MEQRSLLIFEQTIKSDITRRNYKAHLDRFMKFIGKSWDDSVEYINRWMKDHHKDDRFLLYGKLLTTSENKKDRIHKILKG